MQIQFVECDHCQLLFDEDEAILGCQLHLRFCSSECKNRFYEEDT